MLKEYNEKSALNGRQIICSEIIAYVISARNFAIFGLRKLGDLLDLQSSNYISLDINGGK
jgi:hypothetical protein